MYVLQPSSASVVSAGELTMRKLFHALEDEGFRVPTAVSDCNDTVKTHVYNM